MDVIAGKLISPDYADGRAFLYAREPPGSTGGRG
jgi:hypothetical protein